MSITGEPGRGPMRVGIPIDDLTAGNLLALGCMMALFDRERTGVGRWVTTSLLEAQIFMLDFQASRWLMEKEVAGQAGNDHPTGIPTGVFPTSDGHINIAASLVARVHPLLRGDRASRTGWSDPEWKTQVGRSKHRKAINAAIGEITKTKPSNHWIELFEANGIPCGPIYSIDQVFADPQVKHLGMATKMNSPYVGETEVVASAINISGFSKAIRPLHAGCRRASGRDPEERRLHRCRDRRHATEREPSDMLPDNAETKEYAGGKMLAAKDDGVGLITFNQPEKRNAMSMEMWTGLGEILDEFAADDTVSVVILTGAGDKAFVSGADISQFEKNRNNADAQKEYDRATGVGRGKLHQLQEADHRAHPWLLHGRRPGDRDGDRPADRIDGQPVRHSGGSAVDRLRAGRGEAADRPGGAGARADDPLHGKTDRRGRRRNGSA